MKRNPHPARRSRIATLGMSATAFVSVISSLAWNTHQAELAASVTDTNVVPVQQISPVTESVSPAVDSVTPAATIAPAAPAKSSSAPTSTKKTTSPTPEKTTVAPATPTKSATPTTPAVAPTAPASTVVYTCMSPGGKTENPTATGKCKNSKYGYVLTKI